MSDLSLATQIIRLGEKNNTEQLQKLIEKTSVKLLANALQQKLGRNDCTTFWNYLLQSFDISKSDAKDKRFACVKCFLDGLLTVELSYKQTYDLITRLCQDLSTFSSVELVEVLERCIEHMRIGDPKSVSWKDLLPETLNILAALPHLSVNGITMPGGAYRETTIRSLYTMRWASAVLTPIADMFKELHLNASEIVIVLNKFSTALQTLSPAELPALAYQLFSMCSTAAQIVIPILAFEKYFHRFYYKKLFADMMSNSTDFDSIDSFSDKELREAEETILHHLNYCTQYKISEIQMCIVLRNFMAMPDIMLTPFMLSAVLSMTAANRDPDTRLSTSMLLHFLRNIIKNNEDERQLADYSVWCRDSFQRKQVDLEQIFTVLIDQNKDGKDVITPGLVNLVFVLLKAKNNKALNHIAIGFLIKFIRKRFVFGRGIVKKLAEWMVVEQEQYQYGECLTLLSVADTFTVSECVKTINYVMDFFLWIPGEQAMRMMGFILPILKLSCIVRDAFIEVLRKAMNSSDIKTRRMAVYGFCMILKQLNNSNSQRSQMSQASGMCTQNSISGFSLMSQATLGNRNNPQRHFDMLTLEIIGLLRNCFNQSLDIRRTLYENLQRAVELNSKLVPHVLQFIDWHFRAYFNYESDSDDLNDTEFAIKFDKIVYANDAYDNEIEVVDNLGSLILFIAHCLLIFEKFEADYDTREMRRLLKLSIEKIIAKQLHFEDTANSLSQLKSELIAQQLNFMEGLMAYSLLSSKQGNENVKHLLPLFREHQKLSSGLKSQKSKKTQKKSKASNDTTDASSVTNITVNGVVVKGINTNVENIWDLVVVEKLLRLLHEDIVPFATSSNTNTLRSNCELVRYVLEVAIGKIEGIRLEPEYKQLAHSRRTLKYLTDITKIIYERCIKRLPELWRDFDPKTACLAAECFQQCLQTANEVYKKKFNDIFVKGFDFHMINNSKEATATLHDVIDEFMQELQKEGTNTTPREDIEIPSILLQCLEVLYDNITYENRLTTESYTWLLKFCKTYKVETKEMSLVHKLLFMQRQKTHSGPFYNMIALHLSKILGAVNEQQSEQNEIILENFNLKSITLGSAESCLQYLYVTLRKQIEEIEYFIIKANNANYKYRIVGEEDRDLCFTDLRTLERSICSQLVHISNALLNLSNVCIPLGLCMDGLLRLLMQHYICLKNLAKHLLNCSAIMKVSIQGTKFDSLLQVVGKSLPANVYRLITYIEANIFDEKQKKKIDPKAEKAKVLRETKLLPKIIHCIENFNKHVILLAKKTSTPNLANLLHYGVVRDFRIKTSALKAAIERTLSHSSEIEVDPSEQDENEQLLNDEETLLQRMDVESSAVAAVSETETEANENESVDDEQADTVPMTKTKEHTKSKAKKTKAKNTKSAALNNNKDTDDDHVIITPEDTLEHESDQNSESQVFKNLAKINKNAKKRSLRDLADNDPDVRSMTPQPKKRRGRSTKK